MPLVRLCLICALALALGGCLSSEPLVQQSAGGVPSFQRLINPFEVIDGAGSPYTHAFLGGLNIPRPQFIDIDGDADPDLFLQEYTNEIMFLENTGKPEDASFTWRTDKYRGLDIGEWYRFADVDDDGDYDLLTEQPYSYIRYYANTGTPTTPQFEILADTLRDVDGDPIFSDRQNIPNVTDIDCDQSADLFIGRLDGTVMRYEAVKAEIDEVPVFRLVTDRFENIEIVAQFGQPGQMNQPPMPNIPRGNPPGGQVPGNGLDVPGRGEAAPQPSGRLRGGTNLHGANTMTFADIDGDGDKDLFWGDFFEPSVLRIENTGSCQTPVLRSEPRPFPPPDPILSSGYNAPAFTDIDDDGNLDLFVGVLGGAFNPNRTVHAPFYFYEQYGDELFRLRTRRYLDQIDVGSESFPALADLDTDGDLDLLLSNKISSEQSQTSVLVRFENTGTPSQPRFVLRDSLDLHPSYHYAPALADLDDDGDADMLVGTWNDGVAFYRNMGAEFELVDQSLVQLTRGSHSTPALVDIDDDGDLDLFVGETSGTINYYRNTGGAAEPAFELVSDEYLEIDVGRRSVPAFLDIDSDGDQDMIVGSENEGLLIFRNTGTSTEPMFERDAAITDQIPIVAAPAFGDVDADGVVDLLVGGIGGGLRYFAGSNSNP